MSIYTFILFSSAKTTEKPPHWETLENNPEKHRISLALLGAPGALGVPVSGLSQEFNVWAREVDRKALVGCSLSFTAVIFGFFASIRMSVD